MNWQYLASLDFGVVWTYRGPLLAGFTMTVLLTMTATIVGIGFGTSLAALSQSRIGPLRWAVIVYVEFWRNTPLVVQLAWIHFALPLLTHINTTVLESGLIALCANAAAYFAEIVRAGVEAVPKGQWEAADALGLSVLPKWRLVILPQSTRIIIPPLASMVISIFKATSILSILSINDLMRVTENISNYTFKPIELYTFAAAIYFVCGMCMTRIAGMLEQRLVVKRT